MKLSIRRIFAASAIFCAFSVQASSADDLIAHYSDDYRALGMADLDLSYKIAIENLLRETDIPAQRRMFVSYAKQLRGLDLHDVGACQQVDLKQIDFEVNLNLQKLDLLERFKALGDKAVVTDGGLHSVAMGSAWYDYLRKRWLTIDTTPEGLLELGESQLSAALAHYHRLQEKMGYAGRDQAFADYLSGPDFIYPAGETPEADYKARQAIVFRNLDKLFPAAGIEPALIKPIARGPSFPADAFYDPDDHTFYFNLNKTRFDRRNVDMLLLHESVPGHHYQSSYAKKNRVCPLVLPHIFYGAYAEGWGAYVEEYGTQLGLYAQPSDELGAVEWDLVRSIRVILDVGINRDGWSHQQALDYWHRRLPMLPQLAERETTRVLNWPVQAITYKQGQATIRQLRDAEQARLGKDFDLRRFHEKVLENGAVPLALLPELAANPVK